MSKKKSSLILLNPDRKMLLREWVQSLKCPILRIDGTKPVEENINYIMEQIQN